MIQLLLEVASILRQALHPLVNDLFHQTEQQVQVVVFTPTLGQHLHLINVIFLLIRVLEEVLAVEVYFYHPPRVHSLDAKLQIIFVQERAPRVVE